MERITLLNQALSLNWAMREDAFHEMINYLQGMSDPLKLSQLMHVGSSDQIEKILTEYPGDPKAIRSKVDKGLPGAYRAEFRDNVAILPVRGPIFPRANIMTSWSGATSISSLSIDLQTAIDNDSIDTIIQNVDSPGGEITGINEYAQMISKARASGKKIISYVYGQGASAAFWVIAPSYKVYLAKTAMVGSIGVVAGYTLTDKMDEKKGIQHVEIVSSQSPKKRLNPTTSEGRSQIQNMVNGLADIFIAAVASARNVSVEKVLSDFGEGGMLLADQAVKVGMADGISTLEDIIEENIHSINSFYLGGSMLTIAQVKAEAPDVYNAIINEGKALASAETAEKVAAAKKEGTAEGHAAGVKAENERIAAIEDLSVVGSADIIKALKFDSSQTVETVSVAILRAQKERSDKLKGYRNSSGSSVQEETEGLDNPSGSEDEGEELKVQEAMNEGINSKVR